MTLTTIKECIRLGIHIQKDIIQDAIRADGIRAVRYIWENKEYPLFPPNYFTTDNDFITTCAQADNYECCHFLIGVGCYSIPEVLPPNSTEDYCAVEAAIHGNTSILRLFHSVGIPVCSGSLLEICAKGTLDAFIFCVEECRIPVTIHHTYYLIKHRDLLEYAIRRTLFILTHRHIDIIIRSRCWDSAEFLLQNNLYLHLFQPEHLNRFVIYSKLNLIKECLEKGLTFSHNVCSIPIQNRDFSILHTLHTHGYPVGIQQCKIAILKGYKEGLYYCVRYITKQEERECVSLAFSNHQEEIGLDLIQRGCLYDMYTICKHLSKQSFTAFPKITDHPVFRGLLMNLSSKYYTEDGYRVLHKIIQLKKAEIQVKVGLLHQHLSNVVPKDVIQYVIASYV